MTEATSLPQLPNSPDVFDPAKGYQALLPHAGRRLGSHEIKLIQQIQMDQRQRLGDYLLRDGALLPGGGRILLGALHDGLLDVELAEGRVYIRGSIHDVPARSIVIPATGTVIVGVRLTAGSVSYLQDPTLRGLVPGTLAHSEPMSSAYYMRVKWGYEGDGEDGALYPIYTIRDGVLIDENPPPTADPYLSTIELYDRHAHGSYVVNGFRAIALGPDGSGNQVFVISEGTVNVFGRKISRSVSTRMVIAEAPDLELVQSEPVKCVGDGPEHNVNLRFGPINDVSQVTVLAMRTVTLTHGPYAGAADALPDPTVQEIVSVQQGATTFPPESYSLVSTTIAWPQSGQQPAPGESYQVTYLYYRVVVPDAVTERGITITGAARDTTALIHYRFKLPRIDAIAVDRRGNLEYVQGVSSRLSPQPVEVDNTLIKIADVYVIWGGTPVIKQVGTVRMEMAGIRSLERMIGDLYALVADERLQRDITSRDPTAKLGVFSDPLLDDDLRDQGIEQTGAIVNGVMQLPIAATITPLGVPLSSLPYEDEIVIEQDYVTQEWKINPYMAFAPPPVVATLTPSIDIWAEEVTNWTSIDTARFINAAGGIVSNPAIGSQWQVSAQWTEQQVLDSRVEAIEFIRQRPVQFTIEGFGPGERLVEVTFDGVDVTP